MVHIAEQTPEEKMAMYMKLSKKELAAMLIECNRIISAMPLQVVYTPPPVYPFGTFVTTTGNNVH